MKFIQGTPRDQTTLFPSTLDQIIAEDNPVRAIDTFVESLDLEQMGFNLNMTENGRPAYHPALLLKIYIYGYMNRIRSSRSLEKECQRNVEMMWLTQCLAPDHNTINNFRKDHAIPIKNVFRATVEIAQNHKLIGGTLIAGDSTKLRAQNSKKNNYNQKKIDRHLQYIENKLEEYNQILDNEDSSENEKADAQQQIQKHTERKIGYENLEKQLNETGEKQISTSDPDSRHLPIRGNITEVAYSVQAAVDNKNKIPIDYEVTNEIDANAMGGIVERSKEIIGHNNFTALFDKGYHTGAEFKKAAELEVDVLVAIPHIGRASQAPNADYNAEKFIYNPTTDTYTCPENQTLSSNGTWYKSKSAKFKQYKTKACKTCKFRTECTTAKVNGKIIQRSEYKTYIEANAKRVAENKEVYRARQAIVEHPFGTMKRNWGFDHIMPKKYLHRAAADVGLIFIAYNLKRILNLLNASELSPYNKLKIIIFDLIQAILSILNLERSIFSSKNKSHLKLLRIALE